ncbi:MAG: pilus assembly protein [Acidobacteriota bacterium]|nr:pilus assembly protein [Blastocatellia bacterium]MDW8241292.1 pilus assembly protein [Acidobacteriota bacterium]
MSRRRSQSRRQRGHGLVELTLTMPLLVLIFSGLAHIGWVMQNQHVITNASRVGARAATQPGGTVAAVRAAVMDYCQQAGLEARHVSVQVDINASTTWASVTVRYPFTSPLESVFAVGGLGRISRQRPLQATTVMRL